MINNYLRKKLQQFYYKITNIHYRLVIYLNCVYCPFFTIQENLQTVVVNLFKMYKVNRISLLNPHLLRSVAKGYISRYSNTKMPGVVWKRIDDIDSSDLPNDHKELANLF